MTPFYKKKFLRYFFSLAVLPRNWLDPYFLAVKNQDEFLSFYFYFSKHSASLKKWLFLLNLKMSEWMFTPMSMCVHIKFFPPFNKDCIYQNLDIEGSLKPSMEYWILLNFACIVPEIFLNLLVSPFDISLSNLLCHFKGQYFTDSSRDI